MISAPSRGAIKTLPGRTQSLARGPLAGTFRIDSQPKGNSMETAELIQAAASIAGAMAATQYGKFGGMEASRITELATIAVKIARAIEAEARKQP
jgi:hypothetical protein